MSRASKYSSSFAFAGTTIMCSIQNWRKDSHKWHWGNFTSLAQREKRYCFQIRSGDLGKTRTRAVEAKMNGLVLPWYCAGNLLWLKCERLSCNLWFRWIQYLFLSCSAGLVVGMVVVGVVVLIVVVLAIVIWKIRWDIFHCHILTNKKMTGDSSDKRHPFLTEYKS